MEEQQVQPNIPEQPSIQPEIPQKQGKPAWVIVLIAILSIAVIGGVGYAVYQYYYSVCCSPELPATNENQSNLDPNILPASDDLIDEGWQTYSNSGAGFSIKYPSEWRIGNISDQGVGFGPEEIREDLLWGLLTYNKSEKTVSQIKDSSGSQFSDRKQTEENITVNGLAATKIITTTDQIEDWYSVLIVIDSRDKLFSISNGAITDINLNDMLLEKTGEEYNISFEEFYTSFKFVN